MIIPPKDTTEYVQKALILQGLALTDAQRMAVTQQFALLATMADRFQAEPLPADLEAAAVFRL